MNFQKPPPTCCLVKSVTKIARFFAGEQFFQEKLCMQLLHSDLTGDIIASFYAVRSAFKQRSYSEANYANALAVELRERGHQVQEQKAIQRRYHGKTVGIDYLDLVVDQKVLVEVKKVSRLTRPHSEQAQTYVLDSGLVVGLLLNFGGDEKASGLPFKRLFEPRNAPSQD
jgi:GxxExxY protein